ncbi:NAD(P)/FAD-dependent oxidoreductase [Anaerococcus sp. mt242]|uniref:NAD(P)/FAD-dependent oxidoreductase n=1 Tax=Anaerococcus sp. mt242 TaxID=2661917 RepID=UPI001933B92F|nr:NAD(P)/FAD-dependent oxidoreductase [Anaerococcus sp. mt242]MBM0046286.1 NAD(P)/FAD-dependent oxidoreductase [Anaerococcus sp. mt242]
MKDVVIIGAGVTGTSVAYNLSKYAGDFLVVEKHSDVCEETSKANSGICHGGYDAVPGSMKAKMNVEGNHMMEELAKELDFPYERIGTLVLCHKKEDFPKLQALYDQGIENGVGGMKIIYNEEILAMEPNVEKDVYAALLCEEAGIVDPFLMNIAYAEGSNLNGVDYKFNTEITKIEKIDDHYVLISQDGEEIETRAVVNAAGLYSDAIHNQLLNDNKFEVRARRGEYLLLDKATRGFVNHVLFNLPTEKGKGILVTPTIDGNTLIGPTSDFVDDKADTVTTQERIEEVIEKVEDTVENVPVRQVITSFSGNRAHESGGDFILEESQKGFFDCVGIESPGLTSAPAIGKYMANLVKESLGLAENKEFKPGRNPIPKTSEMETPAHNNLIKENPLYGKIICRCEKVTEGEIVDAINRPLGATTVDGVKRRVRATAGRCQGGFCLPSIIEILARELGVDEEEITKKGNNSYYIEKRAK